MPEHDQTIRPNTITIRPMEPSEKWYLPLAVRMSIHVAPGEPMPDESILEEAALAATFEGWGRDGDIAMVAAETDAGGAIVGAAWVRLYTKGRPTYGYVGDDLPILDMAVAPDHRGAGVGTRLLSALTEAVKKSGYAGISLSVDPGNAALRLYERFGFTHTEAPRLIADDNNPVMLLRF